MTDVAPVCLSCGKLADLEVESVFRPLTALGEQMCEKIAKFPEVKTQYACVSCMRKAGASVAQGDFVEEEP